MGSAERQGMLRTGIVIDPRYQEHNTGLGHPERTERIGVLRHLMLLDQLGIEYKAVDLKSSGIG